MRNPDLLAEPWRFHIECLPSWPRLAVKHLCGLSITHSEIKYFRVAGAHGTLNSVAVSLLVCSGITTSRVAGRPKTGAPQRRPSSNPADDFCSRPTRSWGVEWTSRRTSVETAGARPWKDRADFAAGTSSRTSHWVLSVVLLSKLQLCSRNCSWWFPQDSTSKLCKLLNPLMPK
jgi:hypothetical protein